MDMPKNRKRLHHYSASTRRCKLKLVDEVPILDEDQIPRHTTEIEKIEELIEKIKNVTT